MADAFDPTHPVDMKSTLGDITVRKSEGVDGVHDPDAPGQEQKRHHHEQERKDENKDHFEQLAKETEIYNEQLISKKSPFRFCIYRKEEQVLIDLVILDSNGKIRKLVQKDITHQDFKKWIRHIEEGEGLLFDGTV
ncbi:MAG: hypothetical protein A2268_01455 [Candidatus Raymondbacteria bacterium RifOxyA12_full_50_37]|uniref:Uncharacterized protein n=1 Tax=Candidatus Raymondbacteria bacterium RIFOXYD12_FULL_49_13 TaxID=1817890 RepID=A0A1F7F9P8_UNCRA|nr:MAG: hypothetical protein A2268_01455 [Candidatus Raymondbacteria bacterium RifOxyA12_full_50_37]OGJ87943.1 MAG: hypothetical protein A2248_01880 [Candidatus Raymondbacteria bacterium RIFOXYA2_FULL_49_16]OGJ95630.1 MAG: hypothetical protein A2453_13150 [Candidatus Raymondbacteria bacterium RIFOXYC2_FULL_50_21]OGJ97648.1 MAG: hypothetical protein A2487_13020 [Candidatus Raymondbacteria bacterium RifOxyC12_full_50_8]OGK03286.1 MAG: hypothetical protein A2350_17190 [Candidatus Raymondbacteria b